MVYTGINYDTVIHTLKTLYTYITKQMLGIELKIPFDIIHVQLIEHDKVGSILL